MGIHCADHVTPLYPEKLALTSPTGGGRSVGIVRSRTKATGVCLFVVFLLFPPVHHFTLLQFILLFHYFRCFKLDFRSPFVSSPSHPVEQVAFHVSDLSTCIYFFTMLTTVTFILGSSTIRQQENLVVTEMEITVRQFDNSFFCSLLSNSGPGEFSWYSDSPRAGPSGDRIPLGASFFAPVQIDPGAHPATCTTSTSLSAGHTTAGAWR